MIQASDRPGRPAEPLTERTPRVVSAVKLHRGAQRRRVEQFLAEGENAVSEAIEAGAVRELYATEIWFSSTSQIVERAAARGVHAQLVTERAAKALSDTVTPPGLVAVCSSIDVPMSTVTGARPTLVAVPVAISEPGNGGTIIRVADAAGADAVVFAGDGVDPHNGKSVRSSAGSIFHLPIVRERSVDAALAQLADAGLQLVATAADGEVDLDDADDLLASPTAWLFGNEAHGLDPEVLAAADHRVRIPIHGRAESLNLATAAALCLYAGARSQRRQ